VTCRAFSRCIGRPLLLSEGEKFPKGEGKLFRQLGVRLRLPPKDGGKGEKSPPAQGEELLQAEGRKGTIT